MSNTHAQIIVDGKQIQAEPGKSVLGACLENGIYIPNLCFLESQLQPPASCRLCFVEIDGIDDPVPACTLPVENGLNIRTDTAAVRRLQRSALKLLLSVHDVACKRCHANRKCELQKIARFLSVGLKSTPLDHHLKPEEIDRSHPEIDYYPNRCVLCGKCVSVCQSNHAYPFLTLSGRGFQTTISSYPFGDDVTGPSCRNCAQCIDICPVGALQFRES